jgi:hypothetical protein
MPMSLMLAPLVGLALTNGPALPQAFLRLPPEVRARATVVVSGTYTVDKGPDERLPDGRTRWPLLQGFMTKTVYLGDVLTPYIGVERADGLSLIEGHEYLLVLRPSTKSWKMLRDRRRSWNYRDALPKDEVLAIVAGAVSRPKRAGAFP